MREIFMIIAGIFLYCTIYLNFTPVQAKKIETQKPKISDFDAICNDSAVNTSTATKSALKTENKGVFEAYIERFANVALAEQEKFGIPASITLAQGIVESFAGRSKMAVKDNNHFGIKCTQRCLGCRCANYADDDIYDMFRIFETAWESYREHSKILLNDRYKSCFKSRDYKHWANELQRCGYATSKKYAQNLISIIEKYKLNRFDK
jgi:flagellum-specific peptidoglycan hydrolase FlgJ